MFYLQAPGKNLYQYITDPTTKFSKLEKIVGLTGGWLAKLHSLPTDGVENFNPIQSKVSTIVPGAKHFLNAIKEKHADYPQYYQKTKELFDVINKLEQELDTEEKYIIHGDIHPENIVYDEEKNTIYAIDYTDCCLSHFTRDLGSFYQQLGYMAKNLSTAEIKKLQKIFIDSYLKARKIKLDKNDQKRFNLYKAWTALRSAIFFLTIATFNRPRADALFVEAKGYLKKID